MEQDKPQDGTPDLPVPPNAAPGKVLAPAAQRALEEAAKRNDKRSETVHALPTEQGGPKGLEPTRFGDWERGGVIRDF
jgi:hypothetical protein